jgi:hypothetical protein
MLAAAPIDTLIFIALVMIASFFRWITKEADKAKRRSARNEPPPVAPAPVEPGSDEERVRRFLEALGQPAGSKPPPAPRRQTSQKKVIVPHVGPFGSPLPPLTTKPPDLPRRVTLPHEITRPPYEEKPFRPVRAEPAFEVHEPRTAAPPAPPPPVIIRSPAEAYAIAAQSESHKHTEADIFSLLRSASGLRDAVLLREIFGPPRSLQTLDF